VKNDRSLTGTGTRSRQQPIAGSVDIGLCFSSLLEVYGADVSVRRVRASSLRPRAPTSGINTEQPRVYERRSRCGPPISPPLDGGVIEPAPACERASATTNGWRLDLATKTGLRSSAMWHLRARPLPASCRQRRRKRERQKQTDCRQSTPIEERQVRAARTLAVLRGFRRIPSARLAEAPSGLLDGFLTNAVHTTGKLVAGGMEN
jgi:hypothetical protein